MEDMNLGNFRLSGGQTCVAPDGSLFYIPPQEDTEEENTHDTARTLGNDGELSIQGKDTDAA